jgi:hypothetical protein
MKHITVNFDDTAPCKRFYYLSPPRKPYVEQRLLAHTSVHRVKNGIAVFEAQLTTQRRHLDMGRKSTVSIVQDDIGGLHSHLTFSGLQDHDGILNSPINADKQTFIGNPRPAEIPVLKHL